MIRTQASEAYFCGIQKSAADASSSQNCRQGDLWSAPWVAGHGTTPLLASCNPTQRKSHSLACRNISLLFAVWTWFWGLNRAQWLQSWKRHANRLHIHLHSLSQGSFLYLCSGLLGLMLCPNYIEERQVQRLTTEEITISPDNFFICHGYLQLARSSGAGNIYFIIIATWFQKIAARWPYCCGQRQYHLYSSRELQEHGRELKQRSSASSWRL